MKQWIDRLRRERTLRPEEFRQLLTECDAELLRYINKQAQEVSLLHFGNKIYIRGLIEISNCCRNNCYYCGIRKGNPNIERYRLTQESILDCCKQGYESGFRTFVLQGGEDPVLTDDKIERIVTNIRQEYPDCAITLSLGEKSRNTYERFFKAGANRYLLRHETYNEAHYQQLHPTEMSVKRRLQCLQDLKDIGYQTGTGIMVVRKHHGTRYARGRTDCLQTSPYLQNQYEYLAQRVPALQYLQCPFSAAFSCHVQGKRNIQ